VRARRPRDTPTLAAVLRRRDLRLLLSAGLVSLTGDWVLRIGLAYYVYALTGDTLASALMLLASFIPQIVLGSLAGVFVDRWDLRRTMVATNLLQALGLLPLLAVHRPGQIWIVYAVTAYQGCVQQFFAPAEQSLLPRLAPDDHLVAANALNNQNGDLSRLVGSALGGVAAAAGGITLLALADAVSFLLSAALIAAIPVAPGPPGRTPSPQAQLGARIAQLRTEWADGIRLALRERVLRAIIVFTCVTCVGEGIMSTLFAPFVRSVLHAGAGTYGLIVAVQAVGGIGGGLLTAWIGERLRTAPALAWSAITFGLIDLALFFYPPVFPAVWPALVLMVLVGFPCALMTTSAMTLLQRHTAEGVRGRVFGALGAAEGLAVVAGTCAAGFLGRTVGVIPILAAQGGGYVLAGTLVAVLLRDDDATVPAAPPRPLVSSR